MLGFLLGAIPWDRIITASPKVMDAVAKLIAAQQRGRQNPNPSAGNDSVSKLRADMEQRLSELEKHEIEHAILLGVQALSTRVTILSWALVVAIVVAVAALVIALIY